MDKHELISTEECSLFNSNHPYSAGYSRARCSCGWQSIPVNARDTAVIFQAHGLVEIRRGG